SALEDRRVTADDLKLAVKLAIAPRGLFMLDELPDDEQMESLPSPHPPPPR
ncbi:unnamed protein product, partial [Discosporangium mesarthrocarpum]